MHLAHKQGASTGLVLGEGGAHCVSHVLDHWAQLRDNGIKQLKRIDRKYTITIIFIIVRAKYWLQLDLVVQ